MCSFDNLQVLDDADDMEVFKSMKLDYIAGLNFSDDKSGPCPADGPNFFYFCLSSFFCSFFFWKFGNLLANSSFSILDLDELLLFSFFHPF